MQNMGLSPRERLMRKKQTKKKHAFIRVVPNAFVVTVITFIHTF